MIKKKIKKRITEDNLEHKLEFLDLLASELPPIIARKEVERFLGGLVTCKTLANADARGDGPETAYAFGRNVAYRREALLDWLFRRFSVQRLVTNGFAEASTFSSSGQEAAGYKQHRASHQVSNERNALS